MREQNGILILSVTDNGVGIRETEITDTSSPGLLGMLERALVFGGHIDIEGAQDAAMTVTMRLPLEQARS